MKKSAPDEDLPVIGWREWLALPRLGIPKIKAKVDTGARSSALHAFGIERGRAEGRDRIAFYTHPRQRGDGPGISCSADLLDVRTVRSSNGAEEKRYFIRTLARLHGLEWSIELTLAERTDMSFRMLLGREAIRGRFLVDTGRSFLDRTLMPDRPKASGR
ncbi:MAG: RimK/LysX family protein [Planctomycetota bacterium]